MKCYRIQCMQLDANSVGTLVFFACLGLFCLEAPFPSDWRKRMVGVCQHGVKPQETTPVLRKFWYHLGKNCDLRVIVHAKTITIRLHVHVWPQFLVCPINHLGWKFIIKGKKSMGSCCCKILTARRDLDKSFMQPGRTI